MSEHKELHQQPPDSSQTNLTTTSGEILNKKGWICQPSGSSQPGNRSDHGGEPTESEHKELCQQPPVSSQTNLTTTPGEILMRSKLEEMEREKQMSMKEITRLQNELQENKEIIKKFGIDSANWLQATGQATKVDADDPVEKAKETLYELWETFYRPACHVMESEANKNREIIIEKISSIKNPEDYLDIIMTEALQKSFDHSVKSIKEILSNALKQELQNPSAEPCRFIQTLLKEPLSKIGDELVELHYKDTLEPGEKATKEVPIYKEWMEFAHIEICCINAEMIRKVQEDVKKVFLKRVDYRMKDFSEDFEIDNYPKFSAAAVATAEAIWKMITVASPILLKSRTMNDIKHNSLEFDPVEMKVHAGSTKKTKWVEAFTEPTVISSKTGGVITQGSVFCKLQ